MKWTRDYEIASGAPPLEYGAGGGFITSVGGKGVKQFPVYRPAPQYYEEDDDWQPCKQYLQGYALRWKSLIQQGDKFFYFLPGSITYPMLGDEKRMLFDHNESEVIATTRDGLVLHADDYGLAMRLVVTDRPMPKRALESVKSGSHTALSVGVLMHGDEFREVDDIAVRIVRKATLQEVSLVPSGACRPAFCVVVDADNTPLHEAADSLHILSDGAAYQFEKALKKTLEVIRRP